MRMRLCTTPAWPFRAVAVTGPLSAGPWAGQAQQLVAPSTRHVHRTVWLKVARPQDAALAHEEPAGACAVAQAQALARQGQAGEVIQARALTWQGRAGAVAQARALTQQGWAGAVAQAWALAQQGRAGAVVQAWVMFRRSGSGVCETEKLASKTDVPDRTKFKKRATASVRSLCVWFVVFPSFGSMLSTSFCKAPDTTFRALGVEPTSC